jgi:hypothetical protein
VPTRVSHICRVVRESAGVAFAAPALTLNESTASSLGLFRLLGGPLVRIKLAGAVCGRAAHRAWAAFSAFTSAPVAGASLRASAAPWARADTSGWGHAHGLVVFFKSSQKLFF